MRACLISSRIRLRASVIFNKVYLLLSYLFNSGIIFLYTLDGFHLSGNFDKGLSIIKSLKNSSGKGFLDVLDSSSLGNSGGFIVSGFGSEGGVKSGFEAGYKLGI